MNLGTPLRYEQKNGRSLPRYANSGKDCGSAKRGAICVIKIWGGVTPKSV